jgi:hypothetical protein
LAECGRQGELRVLGGEDAKDISVEQSGAERDNVTGTTVGCACGK